MRAHTLHLLREVSRPLSWEILSALQQGPMRFTELEANTQASARTLTDRLRRLVEVGLIQRSAFAEVPPRVEYLLTPRGVRLLELLLELDRAFAEESTWKLEQS